jgi:hypothetical protein
MLISSCIWFMQDEERLGRHIHSLKGRVDGAVFLDGAFEGLSDEPGSPPDMRAFIKAECEKAGVPAAIYPPRFYSGEPAKRTAAARCALQFSYLASTIYPEMDSGDRLYLLTLDSDEWLASDIDTSGFVDDGPYRVGIAKIENWKHESKAFVRYEAEGDGATMYRILPLLPTLVWGPAHFDVTDSATGHAFIGLEKGLEAVGDPCFTIGHAMDPKVIQTEYDRYNDSDRSAAEGKSLRVYKLVDDDHVILRTDEESVRDGWRVNQIVMLSEAMFGGAAGHAIVQHIVPCSNDGVLTGMWDVHLERVTDDKAKRIQQVREYAADHQRQHFDAMQRHRAAKKQRRAELHQRRGW